MCKGRLPTGRRAGGRREICDDRGSGDRVSPSACPSLLGPTGGRRRVGRRDSGPPEGVPTEGRWRHLTHERDVLGPWSDPETEVPPNVWSLLVPDLCRRKVPRGPEGSSTGAHSGSHSYSGGYPTKPPSYKVLLRDLSRFRGSIHPDTRTCPHFHPSHPVFVLYPRRTQDSGRMVPGHPSALGVSGGPDDLRSTPSLSEGRPVCPHLKLGTRSWGLPRPSGPGRRVNDILEPVESGGEPEAKV